MSILKKRIDLLAQEKQKIEDQIQQLQHQSKQELLDSVQDVFKKLPVEAIDKSTLIGGLLHIMETVTQDPKKAEDWRQAGQKFRKRASPQKRAKASTDDTSFMSTTE